MTDSANSTEKPAESTETKPDSAKPADSTPPAKDARWMRLVRSQMLPESDVAPHGWDEVTGRPNAPHGWTREPLGESKGGLRIPRKTAAGRYPGVDDPDAPIPAKGGDEPAAPDASADLASFLGAGPATPKTPSGTPAAAPPDASAEEVRAKVAADKARRAKALADMRDDPELQALTLGVAENMVTSVYTMAIDMSFRALERPDLAPLTDEEDDRLRRSVRLMAKWLGLNWLAHPLVAVIYALAAPAVKRGICYASGTTLDGQPLIAGPSPIPLHAEGAQANDGE